MPKSRIAEKAAATCRPPIPEPQYLKELFCRYMKAYGMNQESIARQLNCTTQNVSYKLNRKSSAWSFQEIKDFCNILNCPIDEAVKAVTFRL